MSKTEFKKGQRVHVFWGSFETATVTFESYTVASCGTKQLHLIKNDGSNAEFRLSAPFRRDRMFSDVQPETVNPVEHAASLRRLFASWIAEHYADRTERARQGLLNGSLGAEGYAKAIAEGKAKV